MSMDHDTHVHYRSTMSALGGEIHERWAASHFDEADFPAIASDALTSADLRAELDVSPLAAYAVNNLSLSSIERRTEFSDLSITLFATDRFFIEALFWLSGTTDIHQHSFSGAFYVLSGGSISCEYTYEQSLRVNSSLSIGTLAQRSVQRLRAGDVGTIHSGDRLIHSLFHLGAPSITIVVRTFQERDSLPQYSYLPPGIRFDPDAKTVLAKKSAEVVRTLISLGDRERARQLAERAFCGSSLEIAHFILTFGGLERLGRQEVSSLCEVLRERHGGDTLVKAWKTALFRSRLVGLRAQVTDERGRLLLALLLNIPSREKIRRFLSLELSAPQTADMFIAQGLETHAKLLAPGLLDGISVAEIVDRLSGMPSQKGGKSDPIQIALSEHPLVGMLFGDS